MIIEKLNQRLEQIEQLIRLKSTGTPAELAEKLEISERQIYNYLKYLKEEKEQPIVYNDSLRSYEYNR